MYSREKSADSGKKNQNATRTISSIVVAFATFVITKNISENILIAGLIGGVVGAAVEAIQFLFTSPKLKGTTLKKDLIVFSVLLLVTLPVSGMFAGVPTVILIAVFIVKTAYFNK